MSQTPVSRCLRKAIPLHFKKRSSGNLSLAKASGQRRPDPRANNRSLARALQEARTELARKEEQLLQQAEVINGLQMLRTQVEVAVAAIDGAVSNLKEALRATYETEPPGVHRLEQPVSTDELKGDLLFKAKKSSTCSRAKEKNEQKDPVCQKDGLKNGSSPFETIFEASENSTPRRKASNLKVLLSKIPMLNAPSQCQTLKRKNMGPSMTDKNCGGVDLKNGPSRDKKKNLKTDDLDRKRRETFVIVGAAVKDSKLEIQHGSESKNVSGSTDGQIAVPSETEDLKRPCNNKHRKTYVVNSAQDGRDFLAELRLNEKTEDKLARNLVPSQNVDYELDTSQKATFCDEAVELPNLDVEGGKFNEPVSQCLETNFGATQETVTSAIVPFSSEQKTVHSKCSAEEEYVVVCPSVQDCSIEKIVPSTKQISKQLCAEGIRSAVSAVCSLEFPKINSDGVLKKWNKVRISRDLERTVTVERNGEFCQSLRRETFVQVMNPEQALQVNDDAVVEKKSYDFEKTVTDEQNAEFCRSLKRRTFVQVKNPKQTFQVIDDAVIQRNFTPLRERNSLGENVHTAYLPKSIDTPVLLVDDQVEGKAGSVVLQDCAILSEKLKDFNNAEKEVKSVSDARKQYLVVSEEVDALLSMCPSTTPPVKGVIRNKGQRKNRYNLVSTTNVDQKIKKAKKKLSTNCKKSVLKLHAKSPVPNERTEASFVEREKTMSSHLVKSCLDPETSTQKTQFLSTVQNCNLDHKLTFKSENKIAQVMTTKASDKSRMQSCVRETHTSDFNKKLTDISLLENLRKNDIQSGVFNALERNCEAPSIKTSKVKREAVNAKPPDKSVKNDPSEISKKDQVSHVLVDKNTHGEDCGGFQNGILAESPMKDVLVGSCSFAQTDQHNVRRSIEGGKTCSPKRSVSDVLNNENSDRASNTNSSLSESTPLGKKETKRKMCGLSSDITKSEKVESRLTVQKQKPVTSDVLKESGAHKNKDALSLKMETEKPNEISFPGKEVLPPEKVLKKRVKPVMRPESKMHGAGNVVLKVSSKRQSVAKKVFQSLNSEDGNIPHGGNTPPSPCIVNLVEEITQCNYDPEKRSRVPGKKKRASRAKHRGRPPKGNKENVDLLIGNTSENNEILIIAEVHEPPREATAVPACMQPSVVLTDVFADADLPKARGGAPPPSIHAEAGVGNTRRIGSRRTKKPVNYGEAPLNKKLRRS